MEHFFQPLHPAVADCFAGAGVPVVCALTAVHCFVVLVEALLAALFEVVVVGQLVQRDLTSVLPSPGAGFGPGLTLLAKSPLLLAAGFLLKCLGRTIARKAVPGGLSVSSVVVIRSVTADNISILLVLIQALLRTSASTAVKMAEMCEGMARPLELRSRLHGDLVAKNADNPKFARTMSNNFAVQIPHHTRKVGHVDIRVLVVLVILRTICIE
mmetsp:Transcript_104912/g.146271  ORF Transcript_104912/g.146271 Transcript_104912/m.146271 type:complete len:213 (-) Transcript_104912:288-926(-)